MMTNGATRRRPGLAASVPLPQKGEGGEALAPPPSILTPEDYGISMITTRRFNARPAGLSFPLI